MEHDTRQPQWNTGDKESFAHQSAASRWPIILTQAIDDVHKAVSKATDDAAQAEGKQLVAQLASLKYELQHDRALTPLPDDGGQDIASYNAELASLPNPHWFSVPWLFSECYLYRRMAAIFRLSRHWQRHDYFAAIKLSTFRSSRAAVVELATKYNAIVQQIRNPANAIGSGRTLKRDEAAEELLFTEMIDICLWGNATDLSLLASASPVDISSLQGAEARRKAEKNILVNDVAAAYAVLRAAKASSSPGKQRRVDIVLDNSGFELFVDLVLAGYLIHAQLADVVVLHPKDIPWFVSDVVPRDFAALLEALLNAESFFGTELGQADAAVLADLSADWTRLYAQGSFVLRPNRFWTEGGSFWRLPTEAPALHADLRESELVVFKGDLNYRKLTADAKWAPTTPFAEALGPLGSPASGIRVLALRTCKADVVVGLPEGKDEELKAMDGGSDESGLARKWAWTGKWAVVQFHDGKTDGGR